MRTQQDWDIFYLKICEELSKQSKDPSVKIGALVVKDNNIISTGWNSFPVGVNEDIPERYERPLKYAVTIHAETRCVCNAAKNGVSLKGATLYMCFEPYPCCSCAKAVIEAGIVEVVGNNKPFVSLNSAGRQNWEEEFKITQQMFSEAGVKTRIVNMG